MEKPDFSKDNYPYKDSDEIDLREVFDFFSEID